MCAPAVFVHSIDGGHNDVAHAHADCSDDQESLTTKIIKEKNCWQCEDDLQDTSDTCGQKLRRDRSETK